MPTTIKKALALAIEPKRFAYILAERYCNWYNSYSHNIRKNGEESLLQAIRPFDFRTVFDVGANVGEWTKCAQGYLSADFHCFELSASTFNTLKNNLKNNGHAHNIALSNETATIQYKNYGENSTVNTISLQSDFWDREKTHSLSEAQAYTGDEFCYQNNIDYVDFLKIDVEGAEGRVLQGFSSLLKRGRIRLIQFEYGYANADEKFLMKDFFELFDKFDYRIGRIHRSGVAFKDFNHHMNNFESGPNYVALRADDGTLMSALKKW